MTQTGLPYLKTVKRLLSQRENQVLSSPQSLACISNFASTPKLSKMLNHQLCKSRLCTLHDSLLTTMKRLGMQTWIIATSISQMDSREQALKIHSQMVSSRDPMSLWWNQSKILEAFKKLYRRIPLKVTLMALFPPSLWIKCLTGISRSISRLDSWNSRPWQIAFRLQEGRK